MSVTATSPQDDLIELFRATILEHARHPRNYGSSLIAPDIETHGVNASCGDRVTLRLCIDDAGTVRDIEWEGQGCAISQASISMMTRAVKGRSVAEIAQIIAAFDCFLKGEPIPNGTELGELEALAGVRRYPIRMKCATLGWQTLQDSLEIHRRSRQ